MIYFLILARGHAYWWEREREREREERNIDWFPLIHALTAGPNLQTRPDRESNLWLFSSQDNSPTNRATLARAKMTFYELLEFLNEETLGKGKRCFKPAFKRSASAAALWQIEPLYYNPANPVIKIGHILFSLLWDIKSAVEMRWHI